MNIASDPVNIPVPQFVDFGISRIDALDKSSSLCNPTTRVRRPINVSHGSATDHIFVRCTAVREKLSANSDHSYKTDFENLRKNQEFER